MGSIIEWGIDVRFKHVCTGLYLTLVPGRSLHLTDGYNAKNTIFTMTSVIMESPIVTFESYTRIQHVQTSELLALQA